VDYFSRRNSIAGNPRSAPLQAADRGYGRRLRNSRQSRRKNLVQCEIRVSHGEASCDSRQGPELGITYWIRTNRRNFRMCWRSFREVGGLYILLMRVYRGFTKYTCRWYAAACNFWPSDCGLRIKNSINFKGIYTIVQLLNALLLGKVSSLRQHPH
jgi:hypothetical protein